MSGWAYYFFAKVFLHLRGHIPFDVVANLGFAAWILLPTPPSWNRHRTVVWGRRILTVAAGALLAWHDSWLPPLPSALTFIRHTPLPSGEFLVQLAWRSLATVEVAALVAMIAVAVLIRRRIRLTPVVLVLLAVVAIKVYGKGPEGVDGALASFYARQAEQAVTFPGRSGPEFDVVLLHVCSLSWDDLNAAGLDRDPFFDQFDIVFTRFNSVTSHSNPSAIRLLRSGCGQSSHDALYRPAREDCYLPDRLSANGYRLYSAWNHDGTYAGFAEEVTRLGHASPPVAPEDAPIRSRDFTGEPVYDDYAMLADWWRLRKMEASARAMLYYNTITLHDGGRRADDREWWTRDRSTQYAEFVRTLFRDFERFFSLMEADGRRVAVVMVAEHGLALRGSRVQLAGLREVPLPSITTVPVGVKLIGPGWFRGDHPAQQVVDRPTSYLAVASVVAQLAARPTFDFTETDLRVMADRIPSTAFVAENQGAIVVRDGEKYLAKGRSFGMHWVELRPDTVGVGAALQTARR